jgi:hypothetical protein
MRKFILSTLVLTILMSSAALAKYAPTKVSVDGTIDVLVQQDGNTITFSSKPETDDETANMFEVVEKNNMVMLKTKPVGGVLTYSCDISAIRTLEVGGTSSLTSTNMLSFSSLSLIVNGVIEGPLLLNCPTLNIDTRGVNTLIIQGTGNVINIVSKGVGIVCAKNFTTTSATISNSGTGDVWVNANSMVNAKAVGVSKVYYKSYKWSTNPAERLPKVSASTQGLGRVKVWENEGGDCAVGKEIKTKKEDKDADTDEVEIKSPKDREREIYEKRVGKKEADKKKIKVKSGTTNVETSSEGNTEVSADDTKVEVNSDGSTAVKADSTAAVEVNGNSGGTKVKGGNATVEVSDNGNTTIQTPGSAVAIKNGKTKVKTTGKKKRR